MKYQIYELAYMVKYWKENQKIGISLFKMIRKTLGGI